MATAFEIGTATGAPDRAWWRQRWLAILVGFALAGGVGAAYAMVIQSQGGWSHGQAWERALIVRMHHPLPSVIDALMLVFPWFGTNISLIPAVAIMVWWLWVKRDRPHLAVRLATVQLGSYLLNPLLKAMFDRTRPEMFEQRGWFGWTSYPSGHAIASISVLVTVAIILRREFGWRWPFAVLVPIILASLYSRIYLGVHWPTDVIGGVLVGAVWLAVTIYAFRDGETDARAPRP